MFLAALAAIQGASTAIKVLVGIAIVALFASIFIYVGIRWELSNTMEVQSRLDKFVTASASESDKLKAKINLSHEQRRSDKEISDVQINHAISGLVFYADELRKLRQKDTGSPLFPPAAAGSKSPGLACFDRAESDRADETYRIGIAAVKEKLYGISETCSKGTIELDGIKAWAQKLPPGTVTFTE